LAADLMMVIGLGYMLRQVRVLVDVSFRRMFIWPTIALLAGGIAVWQLTSFVPMGDVALLVVKAAVYGLGYTGILLIFERREYVAHFRTIVNLLHESTVLPLVSGRKDAHPSSAGLKAGSGNATDE
jgi:hypothetical protein